MSGRVWLGVFFLIFGFGFLLDQLNLLDFWSLLGDWWPLILIVIGLLQIIKGKHTSRTSGFIMLLIGFIFLINQWVDVDLTDFIWPLVIIAIGLTIVFTQANRSGRSAHTEDDLDIFALFSGGEIRPQSQHFQGGSVTAIFGGAEIDLRDARIVEGAKINVVTFMGGAEIKVPDNVQVEITATPIFGGIEDKTRVNEGLSDVPILRVNCLAIFGGVEINN